MNKQKLSQLIIFFQQIIVYSTISLFFIVIIPRDPDNTGFLGFSPFRLLLAALLLFFLAVSLFIFVSLKTQNGVGRALNKLLWQAKKNKLISSVIFLLFHLGVLVGVFFGLLWLRLPNYSPYFIRFAPLIFF